MEVGGDGLTLIGQAKPVRYTGHEKGFQHVTASWEITETDTPHPLHPTFQIPGWDMKLCALFQPGDGTLPK